MHISNTVHKKPVVCLSVCACVYTYVFLFQSVQQPAPSTGEVAVAKPSLLARIKATIIHSYHGFRLFFLDLRVSSRLLLKTLRGQALSRREQKQVRPVIVTSMTGAACLWSTGAVPHGLYSIMHDAVYIIYMTCILVLCNTIIRDQ